MILHKFIG